MDGVWSRLGELKFVIIRGVVSTTFESFSQNGEDVVLWRALHDVGKGRYIDVGANHPELFSVSMGFYQRGWSGITVEPDPAFAQMQRDGASPRPA